MCLIQIQLFKGAGSRNSKQTGYLYDLYCFPHVAIVFRSNFGGWGESTIKLLLKIHQDLCNRTTYECLVCSSHGGGGGGASMVKVPGDVPPKRVYLFGPLV